MLQVDIVPREERDETLRPGQTMPNMPMPGQMGYWPPGQPGPMGHPGSDPGQPPLSGHVQQAQQPQQFPQVVPSMAPRPPGMQMDPSMMQVASLTPVYCSAWLASSLPRMLPCRCFPMTGEHSDTLGPLAASLSSSKDATAAVQAYYMQQHTGQQDQQQQPALQQPQGQWQHLSQQQRPMQMPSFDRKPSDEQTNGQ